MRRALSLLGLLLGCQALPSGVPLANTGGVLEDNGTARDRRAQAAPLPSTDAVVSVAPVGTPRPGPSAVAQALPDAGAPPPTSSEDAGVTVAGWAGDYYGNDKLVRHFEDEPDDVELDDKAHTRVEQRSSDSLVISIVNSASGETICALHATLHGTSASLDSGQSCFGEEGANASVTDGRITRDAERLSLDFSGKVVARSTTTATRSSSRSSTTSTAPGADAPGRSAGGGTNNVLVAGDDRAILSRTVLDRRGAEAGSRRRSAPR